MDVLSNYTPVNRYFSLIKSIEDAPKFDSKRAQRKLRSYVENHDYATGQKAEIIVDHFHDSAFPAKPPSTRGQVSPFPRSAALSPSPPALEHFASTAAAPSRVEHRNQAVEFSCDTCHWRGRLSTRDNESAAARWRRVGRDRPTGRPVLHHIQPICWPIPKASLRKNWTPSSTRTSSTAWGGRGNGRQKNSCRSH